MFHIGARQRYLRIYNMEDGTWRAQVCVMTGLLRSHLSQFEYYREQVALNEQLQAHIRTIQAPEAEKTDLQSALSQSQQTAKQKADETKELQGRLKVLREKNSDFKKKFNLANHQTQMQGERI